MFSDEKEEIHLGIKEFSQGELIFSNSVEILFEHLKDRLYAESSPFSERLLVSPSKAMQQWIQMQLADSLSIAGGLRPLFLNQATEILKKRLFEPPSRFSPSRMDLLVRLDDEMEQVLKDKGEDPLWKPLCTYLEGKPQRKITLASHLSKQFVRYGIYAGRAASDWELSPSNWQQALWARIFKDWDYPLREILSLRPQERKEQDLSLHLFAFSHISSLHFHFFRKVAGHIPVYFYQLSPCQEFWSGLDEGTLPILKNLGKVGRSVAKEIELGALATEESYLVFGGNTSLRQLQRDLLFMQPSLQVEDDSIQLHLSTTPYQEIENLHSTLLPLMAEGKLEPKDVIVMAPDIICYVPYIKHVFGDLLSFQIADLPMQVHLPPAHALFLLLDLGKKRWSAPAVLELFGHPLFQQKHRLTEEDLLQIKSWVQKKGIRWGVDAEHRCALLKKSHCQNNLDDPGSTWLEGLGSLLEECALSEDFRGIGFTEAEALGALIRLLFDLYTTLKQLDVEKTLKGWSVFFKSLIETYLCETEATSKLFYQIETLTKCAKHYPEKTYTFPFIYAFLNECIRSESATLHADSVQAVRFCSMLPMRAIPAKIICLIGMNHDAFPRKDELKSLDLLRDNPKCDYSPSRLDYDRYLFLEALLSAREKLIISYLGQDPYDLSELPPSSVLAEVMPYISKKHIKKHSPVILKKISLDKKSVFSIQTKEPFSLPRGKFVVDVEDLSLLVRSSLKYYLYSNDLRIHEEQQIKGEEEFLLSPLKKAILFKEPKRREDFPIGIFKSVAERELAALKAESSVVKMEKIYLQPQEFALTSACTVILVGSIEGVFERGLCIPSKNNLKGAVRAWPSFLLLNLIEREKNTLLFSQFQTEKSAFFDDPSPYLCTLLEYFFFAKQTPSPLIADWIEPILKEDPKKMEEICLYDSAMRWYLRGKKEKDLILQWKPQAEKLYGEMAHAWFF